MPITISSITHTIHRTAGLKRHSSVEAYISEVVPIDAISNHSTKFINIGFRNSLRNQDTKGDFEPSLNEIQTGIRFRTITQRNRGVEGIPDHHSTESKQAYDFGPSLNGITE
ncbi:hypothetical protein ACFXTH_040809 [Malus domestica]